jgi:hypothetical protein
LTEGKNGGKKIVAIFWRRKHGGKKTTGTKHARPMATEDDDEIMMATML